MIRKSIVLFLSLLLVSVGCQKKEKKQEKHLDTSLPKQYSEFNIPNIKLGVKAGEIVLVPKKNFLDEFFQKKNNFFWFYPRKVDSIGKYSLFVWEIDSLIEIPKAFVVAFSEKSKAKQGDFVFTWWQNGTGLQRAYVLKVLDNKKIVIRYLDLDIFTLRNKSDIIDTIKERSFSLINSKYSPGASVRFDTDVGEKFYIILNHQDSSLVCRSSLGKIKFFKINEIKPNYVAKKLYVNQEVKVPFYGIYIPGKIIELKQGYAKVEAMIIDQKEILSIPIIDIAID